MMAVTKYVPKGYSETNDFFASVMVDAPEFSMDGMSIDDAFDKLNMGLDSIFDRTKKPEILVMLGDCKEELSEIRRTFLANVQNDPETRKVARKRLQQVYYDIFRKIGPLLKTGGDIGPDDDV